MLPSLLQSLFSGVSHPRHSPARAVKTCGRRSRTVACPLPYPTRLHSAASPASKVCQWRPASLGNHLTMFPHKDRARHHTQQDKFTQLVDRPV